MKKRKWVRDEKLQLNRLFFCYIFHDKNQSKREEGEKSMQKKSVKERKIKGNVRTWRQKFIVGMPAFLMCCMLMGMTVFAAGAVTKPLENLKTLVIAVIGAVGVIILAKNVMEFAQAYQQQDSSTMNSALKGIVAGAMMAGISTVLTFLGF